MHQCFTSLTTGYPKDFHLIFTSLVLTLTGRQAKKQWIWLQVLCCTCTTLTMQQLGPQKLKSIFLPKCGYDIPSYSLSLSEKHRLLPSSPSLGFPQIHHHKLTFNLLTSYLFPSLWILCDLTATRMIFTTLVAISITKNSYFFGTGPVTIFKFPCFPKQDGQFQTIFCEHSLVCWLLNLAQELCGRLKVGLGHKHFKQSL